MFVAQDEEGKRICIEDASKDISYFCPVCGGELRVRKGNIREHHFSHISGVCADTWNYDMSDWHRDWQEVFPEDCREIVLTLNGVKHRADILTGNTVIEFQHSQISSEEFSERNSFYTKAGYKLVWIFDLQELYENGNIHNNPNKDDDHSWIWNWAHTTFCGFHPERPNDDILLFFQFDDEYILRVKWFSPGNTKYFITDDTDFWSIQDVKNALSEFREQRKETGYCFADLYDPIHSHGTDWSEPQEAEVFNCPKGEAILEDCIFCPYCPKEIDSYSCTAKFSDILANWNTETDKVLNIVRDEYGIVREVTVLKAGNEITRSYNAAKVGDTLYSLVYNTKSVCIIVANVRTGNEFKIGTQYCQKNRNAKIEGYYRKDSDRIFSEYRKEIYYATRPEWVLVWESSQHT